MGAMNVTRRHAITLMVTLLYIVMAAVVTAVVTKHMKEDTHGIGSDHHAAIRDCLIRPGAETLDHIGGLDDVKDDLRRCVLTPLRHPDAFFRGPRALRPPRGVLLHGPPGTGKTMLARALASEGGVNFIALSSATLESKWWGESAKLVQAAFELARGELQPCIVFFDEIDGMGRARSEGDQACVYSFKVELLRNLDGVDAKHRDAAVMVLACTNCPEALDPALRRRLPHVVHVPKPDAAARHSILEKILCDEERMDDSILRAVVDLTAEYTGSDLVALYADASSVRLSALPSIADLPPDVSGSELLKRAGPLTAHHWASAVAARSPSLSLRTLLHDKTSSEATPSSGA